MKKLTILMLLLSVMTSASAQKMTIKTSTGKKIEISCEGMIPNQVVVVNDSVILNLNQNMVAGEQSSASEQDVNTSISDVADNVAADNITADSTDTDSVDTFVPVESGENDLVKNGEKAEEDDILTAFEKYGAEVDSLAAKENRSALGLVADGLAEELSPEYAEFNKQNLGYHPQTQKELIKNVAKQFVDSDVVETTDLISTLFSGIRLTKDTSFVAKYCQRPPRNLYRKYDIITLSGSLGKGIEQMNPAADKISYDDYGDDTENNNKYGFGIEYSHVYIRGYEENGVWKANPLGFAWSWGGLVSYSYEKDMGSYFSMMGKVGIQLGNDITFGVDALVGGGITPYNSFYTNGYQHAVVNKSVYGFKYGVQAWGSLNFSKNTYTAVYGRYIRSVKPSDDQYDANDDWDLVLADFDPSNWTVGLAVGYKFGAPEPLSQDKRLKVGLKTGYSLTEKEAFIGTSIEKITQVSHSTQLNYGLVLEETMKNKCASVMLSAGFRVQQPTNSWFWGANLLGGIGQYNIDVTGESSNQQIKSSAKKLCGRAALQLNSGFSLGKTSEIYGAFSAGFHAGKSVENEGLDDISFENLKAFDMSLMLGYKFTF